MSSLLDALNPQQLAAVTLPDQSALVLAGAGSGKTRVLTTRIAWLIQTRRASTHEILAVTFTNKAAKEMLTRLAAMLPINVRGMWLGTFHGLCNRMLRAHHREADLPQTFQILDSADQLAAIKRLLKANNVDDERYPPRNLQWFINNAKEAGLRAKDVEVNDDYNRKFIELYAAYDAQCQREGVVDFAELLLRCYELLARNEPLRTHYQERFRHILVDEFQDTNVLQYKWLKLLAGHGQGPGGGARNCLYAVGDDDQCLAAGTLVTMADGSLKPIEQIAIGDRVHSAYGGGHFGPARVIGVHARSVDTSLVTIRTAAGRTLTSTPEHTHIAGYAVGYMPAKYFLCLLHKPGVGYRLAVSGHESEHIADKAVPGFRHRARREGAESVWVLEAFEDEQSADRRLRVLSLKYGLPTRGFKMRGKGVPPPEFAALNTERAARWLLEDLKLEADRPHDRRRPTFGAPGDVLLTLCAETRRGAPNHRLYARTLDQSQAERLRDAGYPPLIVDDGKGGWCIQMFRRDYGELAEDAHRIRTVLGGRILTRARLGRRTLPLTRADHVGAGMAIFTADGGFDTVTAVEVGRRATVTVYDLDIEASHNFVANGLLTHNSIYAFRGANVGNMADFEREFRVRNVIKLEQNYRSHGHILDAANALIRNNARRLGKNLWTDAGHGEPVRVFEAGSDGLEAAWLVDEVKNLIGEGLARSEIAVLYRSNAQSRLIEHALVNAGIPYRVYGGLRFFERAEIKHALAYLRLIENPTDDTAFLRIVNFPPRGIGARTLEQLQDAARAANQSLYAAVGGVSGKAGANLAAFVKLIESLRFETANLPLPEIVDAVIERSGLVTHYRTEREGQERIENLNELVNAAAAFVGEEGYAADAPATQAETDNAIPSPLAAFLSHASLEAGENQANEGQDALQLMTVHAAKGLEFNAVFITGLEEGLFPHDNSVTEPEGLEEERRLMYVAITRARRRLYLSFAQSRMLHGQTRYGVKSRFIDELPERAVKWLTPRLRESAGIRYGQWHDGGAQPVVPSITPKPQTVHGFRIGQSVRHARFGDGVIIKLEGSGDDARAKINFGPQGVKELLLSIAKLQAA